MDHRENADDARHVRFQCREGGGQGYYFEAYLNILRLRIGLGAYLGDGGIQRCGSMAGNRVLRRSGVLFDLCPDQEGWLAG